jgi:hypothetical protein
MATQLSPSKLSHTRNLHNIALILHLDLRHFFTASPAHPSPGPSLSFSLVMPTSPSASSPLGALSYTSTSTAATPYAYTSKLLLVLPACTCAATCHLAQWRCWFLQAHQDVGHIWWKVLNKCQPLTACHTVCSQTAAGPNPTRARSACLGSSSPTVPRASLHLLFFYLICVFTYVYLADYTIDLDVCIQANIARHVSVEQAIIVWRLFRLWSYCSCAKLYCACASAVYSFFCFWLIFDVMAVSFDAIVPTLLLLILVVLSDLFSWLSSIWLKSMYSFVPVLYDDLYDLQSLVVS